MTNDTPDWLTAGQGIAPQVRWSCAMDAPLACLDLARETGDVLAADAAGGLYRFDRTGKIVSLSRGMQGIRELAWSDTGSGGAALLGESRLCRINQDLGIEWSIDFDDATFAVATDPFGRYIAVSLSNGGNLIFGSNKKRVSVFETARPLRYLQFVVSKTDIVGAAEYGLICRHQLNGSRVWNEKLWSNVGDISVSGNGKAIVLASFNHGIQCYNGNGAHRSSYVIDGTANHAAASFTADRVVATTLERKLYWLDSDGQMLWATLADDDFRQVLVDPLGEWIVCGFEGGRVMRLDWGGSQPK